MKIYARVRKGCDANKIKCDDRILIGNEVLSEGYYEYVFEQDTLLLAVADGVGGRVAGWKAAEMALTELMSQAGDKTTYSQIFLSEVVKKANNTVSLFAAENEEFRGMASTLSVLGFSEGKACVLHLGDTRIYRLCTEQAQVALQQLTMDWNLLNYWKSLPEYQYLDDSALKRDKKWNKLISYIGMNPDKLEREVQLLDRIPQEGIFLLTSDGIHDFVDNRQLSKVMCMEISMREKIEYLMDIAVENGSRDDQSIIIAEM